MLTQLIGFAAYRMVPAGVVQHETGHNNQSQHNLEPQSHVMTRRALIGPVFMDESGTVHLFDLKALEGFPVKEWIEKNYPEIDPANPPTEPLVVVELMDPNQNK